MSICRSNFGVGTLDGKLFAVGGTNGLHSLESVEIFNPGKYTLFYFENIAEEKAMFSKQRKKLKLSIPLGKLEASYFML